MTPHTDSTPDFKDPVRCRCGREGGHDMSMVPENPFAYIWGDPPAVPIVPRGATDVAEAAALLKTSIAWMVDLKPGRGTDLDFGLRALALTIVSQRLDANRIARHYRLSIRSRRNLSVLIRELRRSPGLLAERL